MQISNREIPPGGLARSAVPDCDNGTDPETAAPLQIEKEIIDLRHNHLPELLRCAAAIAKDRSLTQDGIQEAFLRYYQARIRRKRMANPRAWLFRVLKNYLVDCNRKISLLPAGNPQEARKVSDPRYDVQVDFQHSSGIDSILPILPLREQECIQLRFEGKRYREIARILGIKPGTVASLLSRSLKRIRKDQAAKEK